MKLRLSAGALLGALLLPLVALGQASSSPTSSSSAALQSSGSALGSAGPSSSASGGSNSTAAPSVVVSTSFSEIQGFSTSNGNRIQYTTSVPFNVTFTASRAAESGGQSSSSLTPTTAPTASATGQAGSNPTVTAPNPGQSGAGPDDSYHAGSLSRRDSLTGAAFVAVGLGAFGAWWGAVQ